MLGTVVPGTQETQSACLTRLRVGRVGRPGPLGKAEYLPSTHHGCNLRRHVCDAQGSDPICAMAHSLKSLLRMLPSA